jgi:hypothetical protein
VTTGRDLRLGVLLSVLVLLSNILVVSWQVGLVHKPKWVKETDHFHYLEMAKGAGGRGDLALAPPYCWRVGVPGVVRLLNRAGLGLNASFFLCTNAALLGFLVCLWLYLRDLAFGRGLRVTGLLLVGLTQGAVRWFEWQYWMTDPACLFLVALAFLLIQRKKTVALGAVSLAAAFVRETYVVVYPYYLLRQLRDGVALGPALLRTLRTASLPLLATIALRVAIQPNQPDDWWGAISDPLAFRWRHLLDNQIYFLTLGTFGVLVPLLLLFPRRLLALARLHFDQTAFCFFVLATLAINHNTERPLAYALPVVLPAALAFLREFLEATRYPALPVLGACVGAQAVFYREQQFLASGMSTYQPTSWLVVATMVIVWLGARWALAHPRTTRAAPLPPAHAGA